MQSLPYGWRGKIGLVYIASAWSMEAEFYEMAPPGVTTHTTRIALCENPEKFSVQDVANLGENVIQATKLLSQAPLTSIAFGCTSGSFTNGVEYDKNLIKKMESVSQGIPCTTTSNAVVEALKSFGVKKIAIATPYEKDIYVLAQKFMEESGFNVTRTTGLEITNEYKISSLDIHTIYKMVKEADTPDAEAIFVSCTGLSTIHILDALERDLGKPVISSNQATFWHSLRLSGVSTDIDGFGSLFKKQ